MKHFIKIIFGMVLSLSLMGNGYGMERNSQSTVEAHVATSSSHLHLNLFDNEGAEWLTDLATNEFMVNRGLVRMSDKQRKEFNCMAENVYNEASGEDLMGKEMVASVVINRANTQHKSVCQIVHAPHQFSWTSSRKASQHFHQISYNVSVHNANPLDTQAYRDSVYAAFYIVIFNGTPVTSADYYHTIHTHTKWDKGMKMVRRHGNHIFYKKEK